MEYAVSFLLLFTAVQCTRYTGMIQFRRLGAALALPFEKQPGTKGVRPFEAAATSLAATIGTGNIVGVGGALLLGGPGTLLWMWITALVGMAAKYTEIRLGLLCRGGNLLGPMAYIQRLLPGKLAFLAPAYAAFCAVACLTMGNLVQINAVCEAANEFFSTLTQDPPGWINAAMGTLAACAVGAVEFGGAKRVGRTAALLVPVMSGFYILCTLLVILVNWRNLPQAFGAIFRGAWRPEAFIVGVSRGVFTHEAGLGTAAVAHSCAECAQPHKQALYGIFEVFFDTVVLCTLTALAILCAGVPLTGEGGGALVIAAFSRLSGKTAAGAAVAVSLLLFAFSSILSFSLYGSLCAEYLMGCRGGIIYRCLFLPLLVLGAVLKVSLAWQLADAANLALAAVNSAALLLIMNRSGGFRRRCAGTGSARSPAVRSRRSGRSQGIP